MDRATAINRHFNNSLRKALLGVMEVLEPGESLKWGSEKHEDLVAFVAMSLAAEYQAITGMPVIDLMLDRFPTAADAKPVTLADTPPNPVSIPDTTPQEDALPL